MYNINNYLDTWTTASPTTADYGLAFIIKVDTCTILIQFQFSIFNWIKVDTCPRLIAGCQLKNKGKGDETELSGYWATREFRVSGSLDENGPWKTLVEDELEDSRDKTASLLNFTFEKPVEIQFIRFDLVSFWGTGGALQYFAAIPATSKKRQSVGA